MPSHRRSRITRSLSAVIVVAALAAPAAPASNIVEQGSGKAEPGSMPVAPEQAPAETRAATTTVVDEGFDWGSAAIGAGGAGALILLSLGGAAYVAGTRTRVHGA